MALSHSDGFPKPPLKADATRSDERDTGREPLRLKARPPHEKYAIEAHRRKPGMDYFLAATTVRGQPNPKFADYWRAGWRPVPAKELPEFSGLDLNIPPELVELGVMRQVDPNGPIVIDGLMPMVRPKQLSDEARRLEQVRADEQVAGHLQTQRARSSRLIGPQNTRISRTYGPPDEAPSDQEVEMG